MHEELNGKLQLGARGEGKLGMKAGRFWREFDKLEGKFGTGLLKLCKRCGFGTSLEGWDYCPYCGGELCE